MGRVRALANEVGLSLDAFEKRFRRTVGCSPSSSLRSRGCVVRSKATDLTARLHRWRSTLASSPTGSGFIIDPPSSIIGLADNNRSLPLCSLSAKDRWAASVAITRQLTPTAVTMSDTPISANTRRWLPCGTCQRHVRDGDAKCPFCDEDPRLIEVRPVRSQSSVRVAIAAALAGASVMSSAEASSDRPDAERNQGHSRWGIAQGAARYGLAPSPGARPGPVLTIRILGAPRASAPIDPNVLRRVFMMNSGRIRYCAEATSRTIPDPMVISGTVVSADLVVSNQGAVQSRPTVVVQPGNAQQRTIRAELTNCLQRVFSAIQYPTVAEAGGRSFTVSYRFSYVRQ